MRTDKRWNVFRYKFVFYYIKSCKSDVLKFYGNRTINLHVGIQECFSTVLAGIYIGRPVIIHSDVSQELLAFRAAEFPVIFVCGFGRDVRAAEMVQYGLFPEFRTLTFRTSFDKQQVLV